MYYHIRLDKVLPDGSVNKADCVQWDFRSLHQGLTMLKRDYGQEAQAWRVEDLTDRMSDVMQLESVLTESLPSSYQYIIMTFRNDSSLVQNYDHYQFFVVARDEKVRPAAFSFSEEEESSIKAPASIFQPDFRKSILDILKSFEMDPSVDAVKAALESFLCYGEDDETVLKIRAMQAKPSMDAADYVQLADECILNGDDQIAAVLYADAIKEAVEGEPVKKGEALAKLAKHYMESGWPKQPWREWDVMKAVDLLNEALSHGYRDAIKIALKWRADLFSEDLDDDLDVDYFIRHYQVDALCFAGFCLGVGLGWKKDTAKAARLFEYALSEGYERASHYLNEIRTGRV